jgi:hypothetical protein
LADQPSALKEEPMLKNTSNVLNIDTESFQREFHGCYKDIEKWCNDPTNVKHPFYMEWKKAKFNGFTSIRLLYLTLPRKMMKHLNIIMMLGHQTVSELKTHLTMTGDVLELNQIQTIIVPTTTLIGNSLT